MFRNTKFRILNFVDRFQLLSRNRIKPPPVSQIFVKNELPDIESYEIEDFHNEHHTNQMQPANVQPKSGLRKLEHDPASSSSVQCIDQTMQLRNSQLRNALEELDEDVEPQNFVVWRKRTTQSRDPESGKNTKTHTEVQPPPPYIPAYLQSHFEILYWLGLSPIRGDGTLGSLTQLVVFICITAIGLCNFFMQLKLYVVEDAQVGNLEHYINICYLFSCFFVQLFLVKLFAFDHRRVAIILKTFNCNEGELNMIANQKLAMGPFISCGIIVMVAFSIAIRPDWLIEGYTLEEIVLSRSILVGKYAFFWVRDANSRNHTEMLEVHYGQELTPITIFMGGAGIVLKFVGSLKENLIRDILLMTALHIYRLSEIFEASVECICNEDPTNENLSRLRTTHETVLKLASEIDSAFNNFFMLLHVECWLVCPYFLIEILQGNFGNVHFFASIICVPKVLLSYGILADAVSKTQGTKFLIEKKYSKCKSDLVDKLDLILFLDMLDKHPIAIGHGQFLLDGSFASRFVGVVISCFLLLVGLDKENSSKCKL